jgi:bla regulator protein BlaR1
MDLSFFNIPDELIRAICTTLVYSIWQGLLLAAFTGLIIMFTRKSSPTVRYNLLIGGLIIFCCAITFTMFFQFGQESTISAAKVAVGQVALNTPLSTVNPEVSNHQLFGFLSDHSNTIVLVWFLIVLARTIQLLTGLHNLYNLRRKAIFNIGDDLKNNVLVLSTKMGIRQCVEIAESALVKMPTVIGHLKPLILIPVGLLVALPPSAIEAILVHELAHISRRDYLINLLISSIEVIFFFNPAVLWLASLIRAEREHCCDDVVVAQTSSKIDYIRALVACQEYHSGIPAYAMAFSNNKHHLLGRVRRLLYENNQSLNVIEKSLLSICLVVAAILITLAFSNAEKINSIVNNTAEEVQVKKEITADVAYKEDIALTTSDVPYAAPFKTYTNTVVPDTAKCEIYLPSEVDEKTSLFITNGDYQTRLLKQNGILYQINSKNENVGSLQVNGQTVPVRQHHKYLSIIDSLQQKRREVPKLDVFKTRLDYRAAALNYRADSLKKYGPQTLKYGPRKTGYETQLPSTSPVSPVSPLAVPAPVSMKTSNGVDLSRQLVEAMLNDGLVNNVKSYKLTESELIVNGKRISDEAFRSFKEKNIDSIQKGTTVYYNYDTSTTTNITHI